MPKKPKSSEDVEVFTMVDFTKRKVTDFISQAEAARRLNVSRATINFLVAKGRLGSTEIAGRRVVMVEDVLNYKPVRPGPRKGNQSKAASKKKSGKKKSRK